MPNRIPNRIATTAWRPYRRVLGRVSARAIAISAGVVAGGIAACVPAGAPARARSPLAGALASRVADGALAGGASAYNPSFTPDGRTLVFARSSPGFRHPVIHLTRLVDGRWTPPEPVPFTAAPWGDSDPTFAPDGRTLYFVSDRAAEGRDSTRRDLDVWRVRREPTADRERWGTPERLGPEVNTRNQELGPTWHDGTLYFASARRAGAGRLDLWAARARADGGFAPAERFGGALNTAASESDPEFSPDGRTLLFWSDRPGGAGSADLWASRRAADGTWSAPVPLRGAANSPWFDFTPTFSPDGRWLYFASERPAAAGPAATGPAATVPAPYQHGEGSADLWRVPVQAVLP
jgi:dipeptidyl aminopeptidase/acylaminoacyl peptidase